MMQRFYDLSTTAKLALAFGLLCCLLAAVGYLGLQGMSHINGLLSQEWQTYVLADKYIKEFGGKFQTIGRTFRQDLVEAGGERAKAQLAAIADADAGARKLIDALRPLARISGAKAALEGLARSQAELRDAAEHVGALATKNDYIQAYEALKASLPKLEGVEAGVDRLTTEFRAQSEMAQRDAVDIYARARIRLVVMILAGIMLALALGYFINRTVTRAIDRVLRPIDMAAQGDLTARAAVESRDEFGRMATVFNHLLEALEGGVGQAAASSAAVASASQQLSAATGQISRGAQQQAASLQETAASLEQMTATVRQNAENARQANQLADASRQVADRGGQVVGAATAAMREITASSRRIADIITAIDEIAFQTNLLALNAAVEAARAGEQGRGFAVVAGEVRSLAQRSAGAAKEIKTLIQDSVRKVEEGSALVEQSGKTLEEIVESAKRVAHIVAEIAAASREQSSGIDQVNQAMSQMDDVTQSSAAQTKELSSTAEGLAGQARQLELLVRRFRVSAQVTNVEPAKPRPAAPAPARPPHAEPRLVGALVSDAFAEF